MSELMQWDGHTWRDYGPSHPGHAVSLRDATTWRQVSDLRPGHPTAQGVLTAAKRWPPPRGNTPSVGAWMPSLLLARRRMWTGRRWLPGESTATGVTGHAETNYTGAVIEFTQVLEAGPRVGGPALGAIAANWPTAPRMRLFAQVGPGSTWLEYVEGTYHANNHHHPANGMTRHRTAVSGRAGEYRWKVQIGSGVAREVAGKWCFLLIDGEAEYGPFVVAFRAPTPWAIPGISGLHAVPTSTSNIKLSWTPVPGVTSYVISIGSTHRTTTNPAAPGGYNWGGLKEHARYTFTVQGIGPGWKTAVRTVAQTTKAHTPVAHTLTVTAKWDGAYDGGSGYRRRSDHSSNPWQGELVTGRYSATHGNTHSVVRFDLSHLPKTAHVTSVNLRIYALHWFANSGGSAKIRNITARASSPPTHHTPVTTGHITYIKWTTKTGSKTQSIATTQAQKDAWARGTVNSIQVGPPGSNAQSHYGVFSGTAARRPKLIIKYTV